MVKNYSLFILKFLIFKLKLFKLFFVNPTGTPGYISYVLGAWFNLHLTNVSRTSNDTDPAISAGSINLQPHQGLIGEARLIKADLSKKKALAFNNSDHWGQLLPM